MIQKCKNTFPSVCDDMANIPYSYHKLFWALWGRRPRWVSMAILITDTGQQSDELIDSINGLRTILTLTRIEEQASSEADHRYFRIITPWDLPAPTRTGRATLPETDDEPDIISIDDALIEGWLT